MIRKTLLAGGMIACGAMVIGCEQPRQESPDQSPATVPSAYTAPAHHMHGMMAADKTAIAHILPSRAAATQPANNGVSGTVTFTDLGEGKVKIVADIVGLQPNTEHGFHIHEKGDLSAADLMSTGGHYNPDHHPHGGPSTSPVHAGDFGNLRSDANGNAHFELTVDDLSIGGAKNDILGRAVIIHAKPDDLKSQPAGNAGARVAGGIIELQK